MSHNYIIKIQPGEGCNPDFAPSESMIKGFECEGFVFMGKKGSEISAESMMGICVEDLAELIRDNTEVGCVIRQACAIAEGQIKAMEIYRAKKADPIKQIAKLFGMGSED